MESINQLNFFYAQMTQAFDVAYKSSSMGGTMMNTVTGLLEAVKQDVEVLSKQVSELTEKNFDLEIECERGV